MADNQMPSMIGGDYNSRFNALPKMYQDLVNSYTQSHGVNFQDPTSVNSYISNINQALAQETGQRPGAEHSMSTNRNAVENLFNHLNLGRQLPGSIFDLPPYKQTQGYR